MNKDCQADGAANSVFKLMEGLSGLAYNVEALLLWLTGFIRQPEQMLNKGSLAEDTICCRDIFVKPGLLLNSEQKDDNLFFCKP